MVLAANVEDDSVGKLLQLEGIEVPQGLHGGAAHQRLLRRVLEDAPDAIVVRLRVAALVSSARLYLAETAADGGAAAAEKRDARGGRETQPRAFLVLKWAAVASDFAKTLLLPERSNGFSGAGADGAEASGGARGGAGHVAGGSSPFPLSVVPPSLRARSAIAKDLADAWGPCLDAATSALFASETEHKTVSGKTC